MQASSSVVQTIFSAFRFSLFSSFLVSPTYNVLLCLSLPAPIVGPRNHFFSPVSMDFCEKRVMQVDPRATSSQWHSEWEGHAFLVGGKYPWLGRDRDRMWPDVAQLDDSHKWVKRSTMAGAAFTYFPFCLARSSYYLSQGLTLCLLLTVGGKCYLLFSTKMRIDTRSSHVRCNLNCAVSS